MNNEPNIYVMLLDLNYSYLNSYGAADHENEKS